MDYVLFGIQGSGKGTQGKILAQSLKAAYFEMGGELRHLAQKPSELGKKVKNIIEAGNLVPADVVLEIIENFVRHSGKMAAVIWDGIPRNKDQNDRFEALLEKLGRKYKGIYFELSREEAKNRLLQRRICSQCKTVFPAVYKNNSCEKCRGKLITRTDDNAESIRRRLELFFQETLPVVSAWRAADRLITVSAAGSIEAVTQELFSKTS